MRITAALVVLGAFIAFSAEARAQEIPPRTVTVSATDTVRIAPDRVTVRFAVVTRAQQPEAARQENEAISRRTLDAVRALNIPERQIQVQMIRIQEEVEHRQGRRVRIGFIARRDVSVIIDDLDRLPQVVAAVVAEGANEFGGIAYDVRDRRAAEDEALRRAAQRAQQKAQVLASTLGASIRGVHAITESGLSFPQPRHEMYERAMVAMDAQAEPGAYASGELDVRANVTVMFELE